jgi:hypothetical protein
LLDIRKSGDLVWSEALKPIGEGEFEKETFDDWWRRVGQQLPQLHPKIAEQWIYRHWDKSPYCFLPLEKLSWHLETWSTEKILRQVHISGWSLDPEYDYEAFNKSNPWGGHPTSRAMNETGTWDYPLLALKTPDGIVDYGDVPSRPDVKYLLIEGDSRFRYLNALNARNAAAKEHEIFILELNRQD